MFNGTSTPKGQFVDLHCALYIVQLQVCTEYLAGRRAMQFLNWFVERLFDCHFFPTLKDVKVLIGEAH